MDENKTVDLQQKKTSRTKTKKDTVPSFEEALTRIQDIANLLENSSPALSEALSLYEESAGLLKLCTTLLDQAQQKITVLEKDN